MSAPTQSWDPARYARTARFVSDLGEPLVALLAPQAGEAVLDLGCGDGALTEKMAAAGCRVVGLDASAEQVAAARRRGLDARVADGQHLEFDAEFDAVFSNAALHWMLDPDAAIDGVWRALKPGGRFVGEMGGAGNVARIVAALVAGLDRRGLDGKAAVPWYFPTPEAYRGKLEARGFEVATIALIPRPTPLPGEMADWLETFAENFLNQVPAAGRPAYLAEVGDALAPALRDAEGRWSADYVRLRFAAVKPCPPRPSGEEGARANGVGR
ncbi:MAG: methyltransferase domain-containing protein [Paracoccaceae bacterium]|nr:methyltransferase domain-containing protein [Paracoccaceae bacterium]